MSKITLTNLVNLQNETTAVNAINANNAALTTALDKTLSRDGTTPNTMSASLDMNSNRILNLPIPVNQSEPLRLADVAQVTQFQNSVNLSAALAAGTASAAASAASATTSGISATASAASATAASGSATAASASATAAAASAVTAATFAASNTLNIFSYLPAGEIAAIQNGTTTYDAGPVINSTIVTAAGAPIYFPPGTYLINTQIKYVNPAASSYTYGVQLQGSGMNTTIFKNAVAGAQLTNAFSTTNTSVIVTVAWPAHGKAANDIVTFMNVGSHNYGGLDMEGSWGITAIPDANTIQFNHYAPATSTITTTGTVTYTKHCMYFDTAGAYAVGTNLTGFQILKSGTPTGNSGIQLRRVYNTRIVDVWVNGATADGIAIPCVLGDADGPAQTHIESCRVDNCGRWGVDIAANQTTVGGVLTGHNEISNTVFANVTINGCGSAQSSYLYGGGMKWKGQGVHFSSLVFTVNSNCGIYIPGGAGLPSGVTFDFLVLENNTGKQFIIEGLDTLSGKILEIYNNDSFVATNGLHLSAALSVVKNINIDASIIRATAGNNPYTAFLGAGVNLGTVRIHTPSFQNFGYAGQTQNTGITFV